MTTPDFGQQQQRSSEAPAPPRGVRTMGIVRWTLVGLMAVIAAGSVLSYFGGPFSDQSVSSQASGKLYYCPMHPQIVQDHPGECPICGMTLVLKPEGPVKPSITPLPATGKNGQSVAGVAAAPPAPEPVPGLVAVEIPIERIQRIGVRTQKITRQSLMGDLRTIGVVEANERSLARISPRFAGWIEQLHVAETGQRVRRGQALATIYSPEVLQAQQELLSALGWTGAPPTASTLPHHANTAPLESLVADARRRLELLGISPQEIESIVRDRKVQRAIAIRSPVEGNVIAKNAVAGMTVSAGMALFEVADLSTVWVIADVYESDLQRVRVGQEARFQPSSNPGETFSGKVKFVYPTLDASSRTLRLRLEFRNRPGPSGLKLLPGMYGNVFLDLPATTGLMVPSEAVVDTGDVQYVFVAKEGGRYEPRRVKLGARLDDKMQVVGGLVEGETVVTTANFLIDSESRLRAAIEGPAAAPGEADASAARQESSCDRDFDAMRQPDKYRACRACEVQHRGMGTMEDDCKKSIAKPWR